MPPGYVKTIREEILFEYAKLISRSTYQGRLEWGFVTRRFTELRDGAMAMSGTIREWQREGELPRQCVYCGATENLQMDHLVPRSQGGADSADNMVWACRACKASRSDRGVFEWLGLVRKDELHRLVVAKYLTELLALHEAAGTLNVDKSRLKRLLCVKCGLGDACRAWKKEGQLTCFCLESVVRPLVPVTEQ